jgi:hypothetical protein
MATVTSLQYFRESAKYNFDLNLGLAWDFATKTPETYLHSLQALP